VSALVTTFFFQYIQEARQWNLMLYTTVGAVMSAVGFILAPLWGRLADRVGGKNVFCFGVLGVGGALFLLNIDWRYAMPLFAALAWTASLGLVGTGLTVGQRYLILSAGTPE